MLGELAAEYGVRRCLATLKRANYRSLGLLLRLNFQPCDAVDVEALDETTMCKELQWLP